jgi:hypothetical protein
VSGGMSHTSPVNSSILQQWNFLHFSQNGTDVSTVQSWIMLKNNDTLVEVATFNIVMTSHLIGMTLGYLFIENSLYVLC